MTDRELLEKAAKAGGFKVLQKGAGYWMVEFHERGMRGWNPLLSDGDALRLASKLQLSIGYVGVPVASLVWASNGIETATEEIDGQNPLNRAIVRAAASIGENMS